MVDATTIVKDLNVALSAADKIAEFLSVFDPPVAAYLFAALKVVRGIEANLGLVPQGLIATEPPATLTFAPEALKVATTYLKAAEASGRK
jgi:hypothetical protein